MSRLVQEMAQSDTVRNTLADWEVFKLPEPNKRIDRLLARLADEQSKADRSKSRADDIKGEALAPHAEREPR